MQVTEYTVREWMKLALWAQSWYDSEEYDFDDVKACEGFFNLIIDHMYSIGMSPLQYSRLSLLEEMLRLISEKLWHWYCKFSQKDITKKIQERKKCYDATRKV